MLKKKKKVGTQKPNVICNMHDMSDSEQMYVPLDTWSSPRVTVDEAVPGNFDQTGHGLLKRLSSNFHILEESYKERSHMDKSSIVNYYEIESDGRTTLKETGLRSLTNYINLLIHASERSKDNSTLIKKTSKSAMKNKDDSIVPSSSALALPTRSISKRPSMLAHTSGAVSTRGVISGLSVRSNFSSSNLQLQNDQIVRSPFDISIPVPEKKLEHVKQNNTSLNTHVHDTFSIRKKNSLHTTSHLANTRLLHRDTRRLDYKYNPSRDSLLLIREHCILLSIYPFRCILMSQRVFILIPPSTLSENSGLFQKVFNSLHCALAEYSVRDIERTGPGDVEEELPYEFHCLEIILTTVQCIYRSFANKYRSEVRETIETVKRITEQQQLNIAETIEKLKALGNSIDSIAQNLEGLKEQLNDLAEDEEELALMNLTVLDKKPSLYTMPLQPEILNYHDKSEELLEVFLIEFNTLLTQLHTLQFSLKNAQEKFNLYLDTIENKVLIVTVLVGLLACCIAFSGYIAGSFGMNTNWSMLIKIPFAAVFVSSFALIFILFYILKKLLIWIQVVPEKILISKQKVFYV